MLLKELLDNYLLMLMKMSREKLTAPEQGRELCLLI
jgi:hypothetical protein